MKKKLDRSKLLGFRIANGGARIGAKIGLVKA